jgi:hypothetical protein
MVALFDVCKGWHRIIIKVFPRSLSQIVIRNGNIEDFLAFTIVFEYFRLILELPLLIFAPGYLEKVVLNPSYFIAEPEALYFLLGG